MTPLPFLIIYLLPLAVWLGYVLGGGYTFLAPLFVFGVLPLLDAVVGLNPRNQSEEQYRELTDRPPFRIITWGCMPVQIFMVIWGAYIVTHKDLGLVELVGFTFSLGIMSGAMGINVSHELIHRINNRLEPFLGRTMLVTVCYVHWAIEHVLGHHRNVATPVDPATARKGESLYSFWPRTVKGAFVSAWEIEKQRLGRKGKAVWSPYNVMIVYTAAEGILLIGLWAAFGFGAALFFLAQSFVAISLLEAVNYLEHYGMERAKLEDGRYEKVRPVHSWNSSHRMTNYFLFNLQRHSDHHYRPNRRYQTLRHFDEAPQLPTGYAGMVLLTLAPPLWRRYMDRKLEAYQEATRQAAGAADAA